ncbi:uncharacterized protein LOC132692483 [Panthera onca]
MTDRLELERKITMTALGIYSNGNRKALKSAASLLSSLTVLKILCLLALLTNHCRGCLHMGSHPQILHTVFHSDCANLHFHQ